MGTQAASSGAYSTKTVAFASSFRKTCPSFKRSASHLRFVSTPGCAFLLRIMQHRCSSARFPAVKFIKSAHIVQPLPSAGFTGCRITVFHFSGDTLLTSLKSNTPMQASGHLTLAAVAKWTCKHVRLARCPRE